MAEPHVLLASSSSGSRGGGELYLVALAKGLRSLGVRVSCWLSAGEQMDELAEKLAAHGDVTRSDYRNTYLRPTRVLGAWIDRATPRRLAAEFQQLAPDVIHVNKQNLEDGLDLLQAARWSNVPTVATIHIARTMRSLGARFGAFRDYLSLSRLRSVAAPCIAVADRCGDDLEAAIGSARRIAIHRVSNGVEDASLLADREVVRREWGVAPGDIVLGNAARIEAQKNPLFLLDVLPELPEHVKLVWVGDGSLRTAMEARIEALGLKHRVILDGWRDDAPRRLSGVDLFVLPSLYEGLPLVVLEAMSASLPILASQADGIEEAVTHDHCGYVLPVNDAPAWLSAIQRLLEDEATRQRLAVNARQAYVDRFSTAAMAAATLRVYQSVLEQPIS